MMTSRLFALATALATAAAAAFAGTGAAEASHRSHCRLSAVPGYTGGPSVIRMETRSGRACAIPHHTVGYHTARVLKTRVFQPTAAASHGRFGATGNRVVYRGQPTDRFGYNLRDRAGQTHEVRVHVVRR